MNKAWYIQHEDAIVAIYDSMDAVGNGNVRFMGIVPSALTRLACELQAGDELRARLATAEREIERLKIKAGEK